MTKLDDITDRPRSVTKLDEQFTVGPSQPIQSFRPMRVDVDIPEHAAPTDWIIDNISCVILTHEALIAEAYAYDRRKAGRKIRQQRRRLRRVDAEFKREVQFKSEDVELEGAFESILRAKVVPGTAQRPSFPKNP